LTPGEVMQLPPSDELVLVSGVQPIRAHKARYYEDARLRDRIQRPPALTAGSAGTSGDRTVPQADWTTLPLVDPGTAAVGGPVAGSSAEDDPANGGIRREPELPDHEAIAPETPRPIPEFALLEDEPHEDAVHAKAMSQSFRAITRQAALDPDDGLGM
jgi:type IV secretion system protein VirD4